MIICNGSISLFEGIGDISFNGKEHIAITYIFILMYSISVSFLFFFYFGLVIEFYSLIFVKRNHSSIVRGELFLGRTRYLLIFS